MTTPIRTVIVSRYKGGSTLEPVGQAQFHGFGCEFEELSDGVGNYTVAIVEWPDGSVETFPVNCIKFVSPLQAAES